MEQFDGIEQNDPKLKTAEQAAKDFDNDATLGEEMIDGIEANQALTKTTLSELEQEIS